jgi:hypothetical protein
MGGIPLNADRGRSAGTVICNFVPIPCGHPSRSMILYNGPSGYGGIGRRGGLLGVLSFGRKGRLAKPLGNDPGSIPGIPTYSITSH